MALLLKIIDFRDMTMLSGNFLPVFRGAFCLHVKGGQEE